MSVNSKMTAIADEIRFLSGTTEAMGLDDMKNHVREVNEDVVTEAGLIAHIAAVLEGKAGGSGLDTSDATVTAEKMPEGVTAYAKGEKITGTAKSVHGSYSKIVTPIFTSAAGGAIKLIQMQDTIAVPTFFGTTGATGLTMQSYASEFGDATAEDVAKGKTFTSAAGLKVEGTMEKSSSGSTDDSPTCTVVLEDLTGAECPMYTLVVTILEDGVRKTHAVFTPYSGEGAVYNVTLQNVVCGTKIYMIASIYHYDVNGAYVEISGSAVLESEVCIDSYDKVLFTFTAPSSADEECTIYYAYNV